jgi:hypothetical protein
MSMLKKARPGIGRIAAALALATTVAGVVAAPVRADDDARYRHERREHERHDRYRHDRDPYWGERGPVYVSPPPPVVYAPPPPLGLELVFPIHIR